MGEELEKILESASKKLQNIKNEDELENWRINFFGKSGEFQKILNSLKKLPVEKRPQTGKLINQLKENLLEEYNKKSQDLSQNRKQLEIIDPTIPGESPNLGHLHPITNAIEEIVAIFKHLGFQRVSYPEIEWDYFAFESLNMPKTHPARDEWETFFVTDKTVLTPHTSSGQVREMLARKSPPIKMLNIGKCYRRQQDVSHVPMFYQFEGLLIDKNVSLAELIGTFDYFINRFFGSDRKTRIRPYHFQFTEPSFEIDITCEVCRGKGCRVCKGSGWLELGGAGMVHPNVLKAGKIDSSKYNGFAFGWGLERVLMMKTKINDIRLLYQNDIRFLEQF